MFSDAEGFRYIIEMENFHSWWSRGGVGGAKNISLLHLPSPLLEHRTFMRHPRFYFIFLMFSGGITEDMAVTSNGTSNEKSIFHVFFCLAVAWLVGVWDEVEKMRVERWYELCKIIRLMRGLLRKKERENEHEYAGWGAFRFE
jgi:hypothetical protein